MRPLQNLVYSLSADPRKLARFRKSPNAVMKAARLTRTERAVLLSRNANRLRAAMGITFWGRGPVA